jgi:hypothetical protein
MIAAPAHDASKAENPKLFERLTDMPQTKVHPYLEPDHAMTSIEQSFQNAVRRVVPHFESAFGPNKSFTRAFHYSCQDQGVIIKKAEESSNNSALEIERGDKATARSIAIQI